MNDSILIIDDNEDVLDFLSIVLGEHYRILLASNGAIAKGILDTEVVNLIISDIMMPGIDGFELCRLVKSNVEYCHIPIILLTSKNTYQAHIEGLEVGADAYIQKPFSQELLLMQISNLLKNRLKIKEHFASSPFEDVRVMAHSKTDEAFLRKLDEYIRDNIKDPNIDIDKLADHMFMSRTTFYRKIKSLSSLSPKELIDITRLKKAAGLVAENEFSLYEISKMVGYSSQSLFTRNFQKYFKVSPLEYSKSLPKER
ncbi:two-component system response regulator [Chitinophaga alhagiae]|uniref:Two-component system response regulator n=1 Tax=Chitinophaga alhagiae TaxID=2203219 RepID=A0ABN5LNK0_9BACT|nr:DNA-binding response regulator [Chitinophaga alhagiae]AWO00684.1 two-component system response regulator [Chitinophaga alhagiae]